MSYQSLQNEFKETNRQMRILLLQHRFEENDFDQNFLIQIHNLSARLLWLKKQLRTSSQTNSFVRGPEHHLINL